MKYIYSPEISSARFYAFVPEYDTVSLNTTIVTSELHIKLFNVFGVEILPVYAGNMNFNIAFDY
jgi:hypothetical protein